MASTWQDTQNALARHHFRQVDEVVQAPIFKTNDPDLFAMSELKLAISSKELDKAPDHDGFSEEIIREIFRSHPQ